MRLTTSLLCWGKVSWLCCVQVDALVSYWFDNLGFFSEGKLAATLIIPSFWGLPTDVRSTRIKHIFWRRCWGIEVFLKAPLTLQQHFLAPWHQVAARGVSHFQPFYFVIVLLSLLLLCVVCYLYQKSKKN